jgi:hypothetical protein
VARDAAADEAMQEEPVAEGAQEGDRRGGLPGEELQRDRAEADGDVDRLAQQLVGVVFAQRREA